MGAETLRGVTESPIYTGASTLLSDVKTGIELRTNQVAQAMIAAWPTVKDETKLFFKEQIKNCAKLGQQVSNWTIIISDAVGTTASHSAYISMSAFKNFKNFIEMTLIPGKLVELGDCAGKSISAMLTAAAVAEIFNKACDLASSCCDTVTLLLDTKLITLAPEAMLAFVKASMTFLFYSSVYGLYSNIVKIIDNYKILCLKDAGFHLELNKNHKMGEVFIIPTADNIQRAREVAQLEINRSLITIAQWVSYLALSTIILTAVTFSIHFAPWVTALASGGALASSLANYAYWRLHSDKLAKGH